MIATSPFRRLLLPLTPLYRLALALDRMRLARRPPDRLRYPVVSIGNLSTGGAGKTPLTIALARALAARGLHVDVLSRGYGRRQSRPARVDPDGTAGDFGDEPLLIARESAVPVYVAAHRYEAGLLAESDFAKGTGFSPYIGPTQSRRASAPEAAASAAAVHLLDDGFQHRRLHRDVDILMLNREDWQGSLLPAGNLREPRSAIRRASVVAIPGDDPGLAAELTAWGWRGPIWRLRRVMDVPAAGGPVAAFCGIARPEQFFRGLENAGGQIVFRAVFPDHHSCTAREVEGLIAAARAAGALAIFTTGKDQVRLGPLTGMFPPTLPLRAAGLRIEIADETAALDWLFARIGL